MKEKKWTYYNDSDPFVCEWVRTLIKRGLVSPGIVDERPIQDVSADDVREFIRCHWFCGIAGWDYALRLAGIPDDRPVWTGSAPCQPFSAAGAQRGCADERHLWPAFFDLIRECRPATVVGEQVAGAAGLAWLDHVHADLEGAGYAVAAANLCAAGVGAPHIRQRLYWAADGDQQRCDGQHLLLQSARQDEKSLEVARSSAIGIVADCESQRCGQGSANPPRGAEGIGSEGVGERSTHNGCGLVGDPRSALDFWRDVEWIECSDGKARPTKPGIFPVLPHGLPGRVAVGCAVQPPAAALSEAEAGHLFSRVGVLRGAGNAIVPQVAAAFVMAALNP